MKELRASHRFLWVVALFGLTVAAQQPRSGCQAQYECVDACEKLYQECGVHLETPAGPLDEDHCVVVCEEGMDSAASDAALWTDCIHDSVCPGDESDEADRRLRRYDVTWCQRYGQFDFPGE
jgi:hypothetical protein